MTKAIIVDSVDEVIHLTPKDIVTKLVLATPRPSKRVLSEISQEYAGQRVVYVTWLAASFQALFEYLLLRRFKAFPNTFNPSIGNDDAAATGVLLAKELVEEIAEGTLSENLVRDLRNEGVSEDALEEIEEGMFDDEATANLYISLMVRYLFCYFIGEVDSRENARALIAKLDNKQDFNRELLNQFMDFVKLLKKKWHREAPFLISKGRGVKALFSSTRKPTLADQADALDHISNIFLFIDHSKGKEALFYANLSAVLRFILEYILANDGNLSKKIVSLLEKEGGFS
jgi:hypothetical protein